MTIFMAQSGFDTFEVHMSDLQAGRARLDQFTGFVACGGFSYGDTLGAGEGWARSILFNPALTEQFAAFFQRLDTFALGVCNGCQMMAALSPIIPGAQAWPKFTRNRSEQFEARLSLVEVLESPSIFFRRMEGSRIPIAVAHGEGFADFSQRGDAAAVHRAMRFVDHSGKPTETYPHNPNGSPYLFMRADGEQLRQIAALAESGTIRPVIDRVFPLSEVRAALAYSESGRAAGKVVIRVD